MRLLLDNCIGRGVETALREAGYDIARATRAEEASVDAEVLALAFNLNRVLVTEDNDFGQLAIFGGHPHCGILEVKQMRPARQVPLLLAALETHSGYLAAGGLVIVDKRRTRVLPTHSKLIDGDA